MSRWIDADEIENAKFQEENLRGMGEHIAYRIGWNEAIESISENAPSIEIVRCGECKWFNEKYGSCHAYHWDLNQGLEYAEVDADDFCSYGERGSE